MPKLVSDLSRTKKSAGNIKKVTKEIQVTKGYIKLTPEEEALTKQIKDPHKELENNTKYIRKNLNVIMEIARRLSIVRNYCLFRLKYNTFKEYVNTEFNYTRGRAYQLIAAHEVAEYINNKLPEAVNFTEPQCRELIKVKVFDDEEHQSVNQDKSNKKRLKLVEGLLESSSDQNLATKDIVKAVNEEINKQNKDFKERCENAMSKSCDNITGMMKNFIKAKDIDADKFEEIKEEMLRKLEKTLNTVKRMQFKTKN